MKKKFLYFFYIFFIIVFFLIKTKFVFADQWYKYENNPIFPVINKSFSSNNYRDPSILLDEGLYKMWLAKETNNFWVIGYLESNDGIHWQEPSINTVLYPTSENGIEELHLAEPFVLKTDKYHLWYNAVTNNSYYIRHATSNNGINWVKDPTFAIVGEQNWENNGVTHPTVLYFNEKFYLWYAGWGKTSGNSWRLGLATSNDGINWQKHPNNPLTLPNNLGHVGGFYVELKNNQFYIYYHTGGANASSIYYAVSHDGINWSCPNNDCLIITKNGGFESIMIISPYIFRTQNNTFLYYTGYDGFQWQIGLATEKTYTPTPTPTPTPTSKPKIVIVPGLFASWNKEAILHNKKVTYDQWKLPSYVHEYDGLIDTFKNLGFQKNKDFFIFAYDWRQPIEKTVADLNDFIENNQFSKINLIGHSLGGLIARIFTQKYPEKVNQIISVGSPHQGAIQVYKPLSAGEIDRENTFMWLAQRLILVLNKDGFQSDRETLQKKFPVAYDLLPLFPFLKKSNNQLIATNSMTLKNPTLPKYNFFFPQIYPQFTAVFGDNIDTPEYYLIQPPNALDNLWGNYQDGHPVSLSKNIGDGTVLSKSAYEKDDFDSLFFNNFNHGEIVYKKEAIKKILEVLNINYNENEIIEGRNTVISPSIIFLIRSPATIEVIDPNNNHFFEEEGIIFIENAPSGNYQLLVKGKEKGEYQIVIGQIAENNDIWEKINGSITGDQPEKEIDTYQINFSSTLATPQFMTTTPTITSSNLPDQSLQSQSYSSNNVNQSNTTNQSSTQTNPSLKPTPTEKLLSNNQSIKEKNLINESSKDDLKNNILGKKTKKENSQKNSITPFIKLSIIIFIILLILTTVGYYKKRLLFSLISQWKKEIVNKFSGR